MSVLSEQCEALRLWAKQLREGEPILASDLREAADTILNLRDMAQQAQSEKAALEKRIDELCTKVEYDRQTSRSRLERIDQLKAENAKLREFLLSYWNAVHSTVTPNVPRDYLKEMRELGIEVPA